MYISYDVSLSDQMCDANLSCTIYPYNHFVMSDIKQKFILAPPLKVQVDQQDIVYSVQLAPSTSDQHRRIILLLNSLTHCRMSLNITCMSSLYVCMALQ